MNESIKSLVSELSNGGVFPKVHRTSMNIGFVVNCEIIQLVPEPKAGVERLLAIEVVNDLNLKVVPTTENGNPKISYEIDGEVQLAQTRVFPRTLTNGKYDFATGKLGVTTHQANVLGATINVAIPGTNLIIRDISLGEGFRCWLWVTHAEYTSYKKDDEPIPTAAQEEIDKLFNEND